MTAKGETALSKLIAALVILIFLSGAALLVLKRFVDGFLVAPEWQSMMFVPAQIIGILSATATFFYIRKGISRAALQPAASGKRPVDPQGPLAILVMLTFVCIGFFLGSSAINPGIPMAAAMTFGTPQHATFEVDEVYTSFHRRCGYSVTIRSQPFAFAAICHLPMTQVSNLRYGDMVAVTGKGTGWGLFVNTLQKAE